MTNGEIVALIQKYRDQITQDVETAADGAAVASFLLLTFGMDFQNGNLTPQVKDYCTRVAGEAYDVAVRDGFGFKPDKRRQDS